MRCRNPLLAEEGFETITKERRPLDVAPNVNMVAIPYQPRKVLKPNASTNEVVPLLVFGVVVAIPYQPRKVLKLSY